MKLMITRLLLIGRHMLLALPVGAIAGCAAALFLSGLALVTDTRETLPWLLWLLPVGGACMSWLYMRWGRTAAQGNPLIFSRIRSGEGTVPLRMGPLVLVGTWVTHLLGGSAGREGTAVQLGASSAEMVSRVMRISPTQRSLLLLCGVSGGFGAVFGTPLAGAIFALEVSQLRRPSLVRLLPALTASYVGHWTAMAWGTAHGHFTMGTLPSIGIAVLAKLALAAILFGLVARLFTSLLHFTRTLFSRWIPHPVLRSVIGGCFLIGLVFLADSRAYLGLSLPLLNEAFEAPSGELQFAWKLLFTIVTLGSGYQGGEVTPLFVIGATLGSTLAGWLSTPPAWLAAIGMVAVFAGAARAPMACFVMGLELFGLEGALYLFIGCIISRLCAGGRGLYHSAASQRPGQPG